MCKYYKKPVCSGDKTCTNPAMCNTRICPYVANGNFQTNKAKEGCRGYTVSITGSPHREFEPQILRSVMAGIIEQRPTHWDKAVVTVEFYDSGCAEPKAKFKVPIVRNDLGAGFMTRKIYARKSGRKTSRDLREAIKKYKDGKKNSC